MPMRQDCRYFESRSYPNGDTVRKCHLDLAPEAPWRCPENCPKYTRRMADVNWSYGTLVTPKTPPEPKSLGEDQSIADLLDAAEDIVNAAALDVMADTKPGRRKQRGTRGRTHKKMKGKRVLRKRGGSGKSRGSGSHGSSKPRGSGSHGSSSSGSSSDSFGERLRKRYREG